MELFFTLNASCVAGSVFSSSLLLGVVALASFNEVMYTTSSEGFCSTACHEMTRPLSTLQQTTHYSNSHGVTVGCSDCHIPQEFIPKILRKRCAAHHRSIRPKPEANPTFSVRAHG